MQPHTYYYTTGRRKPAYHASASRLAIKGSRHPAYTFYATLFVTILLVFGSLIFSSFPARSQSLGRLVRRDMLQMKQQECTDIHSAEDQCAFMKAHCQDDDTGILSYLTLYYCDLPHVKPIAFGIIAVWLSLLFATIGIAASDFFSVNLKSIANIFKMSENLAGVTFLAFGNGSPDVFSTWAAMGHHSGSLAVGELIGAAGFITAVIPAAMMFVKPFRVGRRTFVRDVCFFAAAVGFSMIFLANGHLELWEALVMVAFYVVYISFVVIHHWRLTRKKARREREAAARGHYVLPAASGIEHSTAYRDDDADDETQPLTRTVSDTDFDELERAGSGDKDDEFDTEIEDEEEEARDRVLGELSNNMRVARVPGRRRRTTGPIRPSLLGALEFQAVLASLRSQQSIPPIPLNHQRRHSDAVQSSDRGKIHRGHSTVSEGAAQGLAGASQFDTNLLAPTVTNAPSGQRLHGGRQRAVSANGIEDAKFDPARIGRGLSVVEGLALPSHRAPSQTRSESHAKLSRPQLSIQPPREPSVASDSYMLNSHTANEQVGSTLLVPAQQNPPSITVTESAEASPIDLTSSPMPMSPDPVSRPKLKVTPASDVQRPKLDSRSATLLRYRDNPELAEIEELMLPDSSYDVTPRRLSADEPSPKRLRWWPSRLLPPPVHVLEVLFPSLKLWTKTNVWGRLVGIASVPSVLLLTLSLPVVEFERTIDDQLGPIETTTGLNSGSAHVAVADGSLDSNAASAMAIERQSQARQASHEDLPASAQLSGAPLAIADGSTSDGNSDWNRWLLIIQCFLAPLAFVFIYWVGDEGGQEVNIRYIKAALGCLIGALIATALILATTSADRPPSWQRYLSFAGFAVSVLWISTIAEEVVGILKAIGVILNISDAILGLTVFAVGNSLGDLVADITVARLGFPVMALSACFGGPMMNILIGIGTAGAWNAWKGEEKYHRKHPGRPRKFKSYHLEIDVTLLISAVALLITLLGYLVVVPLNKWRLDRRVGTGLIVIWVLATIVNLVVEVTGIGGSLNYHEDGLTGLG